MTKFISFLTLTINAVVFGQISVGTTTSSESVLVDLVSSNKGFAGAHIPLESPRDQNTIPDPADGLLVYNTSTTAELKPGYYTWIKDKWVASEPSLDLDITTNGKLKDYLGYTADGSAPNSKVAFTSENITFNPTTPTNNTTDKSCLVWPVSAGGNGHKYCSYKSTSTIDWQQAFNAAKSQRGYLVTFTSLAEWNYVKTNLIDKHDLYSSIWMGYNKVDFSGNATEFTWITGEKSKTDWSTLKTEEFFNLNEPNNENGKEGCVHVIHKNQNLDRKWNDRNCDYKNSNQWPGPWEHLIIEFNQ